MYRASLVSNNRVKEYDEAFAFVTSRFPKNVSLAAELNANVTSYGFFFNNTFTRGSNRGNAGRRVNSTARDRVENLRYMASASEEVRTWLIPHFLRSLLKWGTSTHLQLQPRPPETQHHFSLPRAQLLSPTVLTPV